MVIYDKRWSNLVKTKFHYFIYYYWTLHFSWPAGLWGWFIRLSVDVTGCLCCTRSATCGTLSSAWWWQWCWVWAVVLFTNLRIPADYTRTSFRHLFSLCFRAYQTPLKKALDFPWRYYWILAYCNLKLYLHFTFGVWSKKIEHWYSVHIMSSAL